MFTRRCLMILLLCGAPAIAGCLALGGRPAPNAAATNPDAPEAAEPLARGQLVLHADFPLAKDHRLIDELVAERDVIAERLQLAVGSEPIHLHLFREEAAYRRHVARQFPKFPERRAIFVQTDVTLAVYAHWGDSVAEDLRHEVAHGYLHAAVQDLPLWLDEGLAEYFEVGRGRRGFNRTHVVQLAGQVAADDWKPNLTRLEQLTSAADMTQLDYAESWLWVHFLLESDEDKSDLLIDYLASLRSGPNVEPLSQRLRRRIAHAEPALLEHLDGLSP